MPNSNRWRNILLNWEIAVLGEYERVTPMKYFLLGVGAQKAGTTWLFNYLNTHPNANMGFIKEYHIFDCRYVFDWVQFEPARIAQIAATSDSDEERAKRFQMLQAFHRNADAYFDYFEAILSSQAQTILTGDITPSYALLPCAAFEEVREGFLRRGIEVKVVFIMRDPVERCISASRMNLKNLRQECTVDEELENLECKYRSEAFTGRTRYDHTIENLEKVFDVDQVYYSFYENMFTRLSIQSLCDFLAIPFAEPNLDEKFNVSKTSTRIPDTLRAEIARYYEPVYQYVWQRFGRANIDSLWANGNFLGS